MQTQLMNIASQLEKVATRQNAINCGVIILVTSFLLMMCAGIANVGSLFDKSFDPPKQVGFWFAPNWVAVYLLLYPLYVGVFCMLVGQCRATLGQFVGNRSVTGADGQDLNLEQFLKAWDAALNSVSLAMVALMAAVASLTIYDWVKSSLLPVQSGEIGDLPLDWSNFAAVYPEQVSKMSNLVFTAIAYVYMGSALFVFLAILVYGAVYCLFLYQISQRGGPFRLAFRDEQFPNRLSGILFCIYICSLLGLIAAYTMRLQTEYLSSNFIDIGDLILARTLGVLGYSPRQAIFLGQPGAAHHNISNFSLAVVFYSITLLALSIVLLREAFSRARDYLLEKVTSEYWRTTQGFSWDNQLLAGIRDASFVKDVTPTAVPFGVLYGSALVAYAAAGYGIIVVLAGAALYIPLIVRRSPQAIPIVTVVPPLPVPSTAQPKSLPPADLDAVVNFLARQALNGGGRDYFKNLIAQANVPQEFKFQQQDNWTGRLDDDARTLVSWACTRGVNPSDRRMTTLAAILEPELSQIGADQAGALVKIMVADDLIRDDNLRANLQTTYPAVGP